jgi:hypothetical protein
VSFPGILRGEGHEANCTVRAIEVREPGGGSAVALVRHSVHNVSKPLPDGAFQLFANGQVTHLRHQGDHWLSLF